MTIHMTPENVSAALHHESCAWILWTFSTYNDSKIVVQFQNFNLEEYNEILTIGDGQIPREDTKLVRFSGTDLPSNITSISRALWIKFEYNINICCRSPQLDFTISAVIESGTNYCIIDKHYSHV